MELSKVYDPKKVEDKIYRFWQKSGFFNPDKLPGKRKKAFTVIMPPPNANGSLHIGHAVFVTFEDIMIRYHRMKGEKALWLPGADHAGFETQVVFDKKLEKEGRNRFEISREQLYKETFDFTLQSKKVMEGQLRKLGASCDWSREKFTLDQEIIKIVYQTFKKLYDDGLAYRDMRPVNWCTKHQTSLSDLEVKYEERKDPLYYIKYGPLTLATVRLETKFGDTAVAVSPKDKRYQKFVGQEIEIETIFGKAKIKVIADETVDPEFGTGVVKITPAHDPNDFEVGRRHNLEIREVIDKFGRLNEKTGPYKGMKILEARAKIAQDMAKKGLLEKVDENYTHTVGHCYKCGTIIEPRILPQWFIAVNTKGRLSSKTLAKDALEAVKKGKVKFVSKRFEKIFNHWVKNLRDWNISRQIVWGIRIPAWYNEPKTWDLKIYGKDIFDAIAKGTKTVEIRAGRPRIQGEKYWGDFRPGDIIEFRLADEKTDKILKSVPAVKKSVAKVRHFKTIDEMLKSYRPEQDYPGKSAQETKQWWKSRPALAKRIKQYGIWVIELSDNFVREKIYIGSKSPQGENWTRDPDVFDTWFSSGQWPFATLMTTKKGDFHKFYPTDVMETGWDILFFWVARMIMLGLYVTEKVPFRYVYLHGLVRDKDRQKMSKSKGNVIDPLGVIDIYGTDALRMALVVGNTAGNDPIIYEEKIRGYRNFANKIWNAARFVLINLEGFNPNRKPKLTRKDKKILNNLQKIAKEITTSIDSFKFYRAAEKLYHYFWHTFADKIIEEQKLRLKKDYKEEVFTAQYLLLKILKTNLILLHPFMPFITEEIYQKLPIKNKKKCLMIEEWPKKIKI